MENNAYVVDYLLEELGNQLRWIERCIVYSDERIENKKYNARNLNRAWNIAKGERNRWYSVQSFFTPSTSQTGIDYNVADLTNFWRMSI